MISALETRSDIRALATSALPFIALLAAMAILSTGTSIAKGLFPHVGAAGTVAYRVGLSALFLLAVWRPWRRHYSRTDWLHLATFGAAIGMMNLCFYLAIRTIPLGIAWAIEFVGPLGVVLWRARRPRDFAWLGLTLTGLFLLLPLEGTDAAPDPIGMTFAATAGLFWALYIIIGGRMANLPAGPGIAVGMSVAAILVVPVGVAGAGVVLLDPNLIVLGLIVAALSSAIPYSLEMVALQRIPSRVFGTMTSIEPAMGAMAGFLFLHEALTLKQSLAIACVIAATAGTALTTGSKSAPPACDPPLP